MEKLIIKNNKILTNHKNKKIIEKAINQVVSFFGKGNIGFQVVFVKTRKKYNKLVGRKTKKWEVGFTTEDDIIYIFDKSVFEKVSTHKKQYFYSTLVHEIVHVYTYQNLWFINPIWLTEGLAFVVADQIKEIKKYKKRDITKAHYEKDWFDNPAYSTSAYFVDYLIKKYGMKKLMCLIKNLKEFEKKSVFEKKFKEVYNISFKKLGKDFSEKFTPTKEYNYLI